METICVNRTDVNSAMNFLFSHNRIELIGENSDVSKFRDNLLSTLCSKGIRNIHCVINRNIIELT